MLVKEYRIPLPLTLEEYRIAQLYMIQKKSRDESDGEDSGVEIIENKPYHEGPFGSGQYTYKIYHIGRHIPSWFRSVVPKTALEVHEESWNAYPCTKTKFSVPFVEKFTLEVDTIFQPDSGDQDNIFKLKPSELRQRELDVIDMVNDAVTGSDYEEEEDPSLFQSPKTGRGPLAQDWIQNPPGGVIMCSYKLIKVEFRYWGLQSRIERFIHDYGLRRVMLRAHRQAWAWQDEWVGLTMEDIRRLESETQLILQRKLGRSISPAESSDDKGREESLPSNEEERNMGLEGAEFHRPLQRRPTSSSKRGRQNSVARRHLNNNHTQLPSPLDPQGGVASPDETDSVYSYYALDTIAINDDSDTEYFDAQEVINEEEEFEDSSDEEFADPVDFMDTPLSGATPSGDLPPEFLFLVIRGGCGLQPGTIDSTNHDIDFRTLKATLEEVVGTHYQLARGRVIIKSVPTPSIGNKAFEILSSLSPAHYQNHIPSNGPAPQSHPDIPNFSFPISALPILASSDHTHSLSLRQLVISSNIIYRDFLESEEGRSFSGHVCILADCFGSVLIYDILSRHGDSSPATTPTSNRRFQDGVQGFTGKWRRYPSPTESTHTSFSLGHQSGCHDISRSMPVVAGLRSQPEFSSSRFMFDVSSVFMFGSPLGYILSHRHMTGCKVPPPRCTAIYNLFYSVDPLAARLEPVLDQLLSTVPPVTIPSYGKYPTGDRLSVDLKATVARFPELFQSAHQSQQPSPLSAVPKRASSTEYLSVHREEEGEEMIGAWQQGTGERQNVKNSLRPFCYWWGDNRIDYQLQIPSGLENCEYLPNTAYAHIVQARYWEAKEMFSFILRQMLQCHVVAPTSSSTAGSLWTPFIPPTSTVKWAKKKTPLRIQRMSPNHRAVDVVICTHATQSTPTLQAKFFYGPLNMASLSGEMVDIYLLTTENDDVGRYKEKEREWLNIATVSTDKHGRAWYDMTEEEIPRAAGVYPVIFLVKGDHTMACCNLFVLPAHTEAVVFSIDGALTSNFSWSGRDMKLRNGALDVVRFWHELGYVIIYITGRPDIQKEYVTSWLGLHGFPMGVVSFSDSLSTGPNNIKLLYLARLIKEAKIILSVAYGSHRHLAVFKELGLQSDQIFIYSKGGHRKGSGHTKRQDGDCKLIDGFDSHYLTLESSPQTRPATVCVRDIVGESSFSFPSSLLKTPQSASSPLLKIRRPRSSSNPKQERKNSS